MRLKYFLHINKKYYSMTFDELLRIPVYLTA